MPEYDERADLFSPTHDIGTYYVVPFDGVSAAVECCDRLVPHTVTRGGVVRRGADRAVVWFHVPSRSTSTRDRCFLLVSAGTLDALAAVAPTVSAVSAISWRSLPGNAVLVFGEDRLPLAHERMVAEPVVTDRVVERPVERDGVVLDRRTRVRSERVTPATPERALR